MEHIIVGGDSFTYPFTECVVPGKEDQSHKKWPDYIPDAKITNVATEGIGNTTMINLVLMELLKDVKVDRVIVALSEWWRTELPRYHEHDIRTINPLVAHHISQEDLDNLPKRSDYVAKKHYDYCVENDWFIHKSYVQTYCIDQTLQSLLILYSTCKSRGIKLDVFQMLSTEVQDSIRHSNQNTKKNWLSSKSLDQLFSLELIDHDHFKMLDKFNGKCGLKLIGWPFHVDIGGSCVENMLSPEYRIDETDNHPNKLGHKMIGAWYNKQAQP
jgi:hypothetical protein